MSTTTNTKSKKFTAKNLKRKNKISDLTKSNLPTTSLQPAKITAAASLPREASKTLVKADSAKNVFHLHSFKNLCELISCRSASSPKINSQLRPFSKQRSTSGSSLSPSCSFASLVTQEGSNGKCPTKEKDPFWLSHQLKPIIKLAEDFEFYTDHEEEEEDACFSSSSASELNKDPLGNETALANHDACLKVKSFHSRNFNCFTARNDGSSFSFVF